MHWCTAFGKHCECIAQKCTHVSLTTAESLRTHPAWRPRKKFICICQTPGIEQGPVMNSVNVSANCAIRSVVSNGPCCIPQKCRLIQTSNHNFCWERKNSVDAENNESFIYMLFKLYVQVWSRLLNSTIVGQSFVGFICAMALFSGMGIRKWTHWLFPIYVHSEKVCSWVFHFIKWMNRFCTTIQTDLLAY